MRSLAYRDEHRRRAALLGAAFSFVLAAAGRLGAAEAGTVDVARLERAVERGLRVVEKAARSYPEHRACFSCHHQTLPMQAMAAAARRGFRLDGELFVEQARFTHRSFGKNVERVRVGEGVGGTSMTVGYGLWALDLARWERDETVEAMLAYLLAKQEPDGRWTRYTSRPPLEDSDVTCTVLAADFLHRYAGPREKAPAEAAAGRARAWLRVVAPRTQEDVSFRLWGLRRLGAPEEEVGSARAAVLASQREDGGWAQLAGMVSDAYATGQALFVLQETGLPREDPACGRGIRFLLETQCADGSWFVKSRSKPIQTFFDNGDPHGADQFISIPATSWAAMALAGAIPRLRL